MADAPRSEAMLEYQRAQRDLFQQLARGEITAAAYQFGVLDAIEKFGPGFTVEEATCALNVMLQQHSALTEAMAEGGHPQPGNNPDRPN